MWEIICKLIYCENSDDLRLVIAGYGVNTFTFSEISFAFFEFISDVRTAVTSWLFNEYGQF